MSNIMFAQKDRKRGYSRKLVLSIKLHFIKKEISLNYIMIYYEAVILKRVYY